MSSTVLSDTQNAITWEEAEAALLRTVDRFQREDIEGIVSRYDDNIVIHYADLPVIKGKAAAEKFLRARTKLMKEYRLEKSLFLVSGQKYGNTWTGRWIDANTGKRMEGFGVELVELDGGKVVRWDAAYNVWEAGKAMDTSYFRPYL